MIEDRETWIRDRARSIAAQPGQPLFGAKLPVIEVMVAAMLLFAEQNHAAAGLPIERAFDALFALWAKGYFKIESNAITGTVRLVPTTPEISGEPKPMGGGNRKRRRAIEAINRGVR